MINLCFKKFGLEENELDKLINQPNKNFQTKTQLLME